MVTGDSVKHLFTHCPVVKRALTLLSLHPLSPPAHPVLRALPLKTPHLQKPMDLFSPSPSSSVFVGRCSTVGNRSYPDEILLTPTPGSLLSLSLSKGSGLPRPKNRLGTETARVGRRSRRRMPQLTPRGLSTPSRLTLLLSTQVAPPQVARWERGRTLCTPNPAKTPSPPTSYIP